MTYLVVENCIRCKYTDCVEVCPVDCFYEGENMLFINPEECIDCGVCVPECPVDAIVADDCESMEDASIQKWIAINKNNASVSPRITKKIAPYPNADKYDGMKNKYEQFFLKGK